MKMTRGEKKTIISWVLLVISFLVLGPALWTDDLIATSIGVPLFIFAFVILFSISDKEL